MQANIEEGLEKLNQNFDELFKRRDDEKIEPKDILRYYTGDIVIPPQIECQFVNPFRVEKSPLMMMNSGDKFVKWNIDKI